MRVVTKEEAWSLVQALPDDGTNGGVCEYVTLSGTHCLVGEVLVKLGVPVHELLEDGDIEINTLGIHNSDVLAWVTEHDVELTSEAVEMLSQMQQWLDDSINDISGSPGIETWGEAKRLYLERGWYQVD